MTNYWDCKNIMKISEILCVKNKDNRYFIFIERNETSNIRKTKSKTKSKSKSKLKTKSKTKSKSKLKSKSKSKLSLL